MLRLARMRNVSRAVAIGTQLGRHERDNPHDALGAGPIVMVDGTPGGLGNTLFQVAVAVHYATTHGRRIYMNDERRTLRHGTANKGDRFQLGAPYSRTIFSKLPWSQLSSARRARALNVTSQVEAVSLLPPDEGQDVVIGGRCQHAQLVQRSLQHMATYLALDRADLRARVRAKYHTVPPALCVTVRLGADFRHMQSLQNGSYLRAMNTLRREQTFARLLIFSDVEGGWHDRLHMPELDDIETVEVNEDDITQLYTLLQCRAIVLSQSTFHVWAAYLAAHDPQSGVRVAYFDATDVTKHHLALSHWTAVSPLPRHTV